MMTTAKMKELFKSGAQDELLMDIYLDENKLDYQRQRYVDDEVGITQTRLKKGKNN